MLLCGGYGAGIIGKRDGVSSGFLPHFLWCGWQAGLTGGEALPNLGSNHLTLHPHHYPFVFLQELKEMKCSGRSFPAVLSLVFLTLSSTQFCSKSQAGTLVL